MAGTTTSVAKDAAPVKKAAAKRTPRAEPTAATQSAAPPSKSADKGSAKKAAAAAAAPAVSAPNPDRPNTSAGLRSRSAPATVRKSGGSYAGDEKFLVIQRSALESEKETHSEQARSLRAEADSLVEEMEPGDVQFDEESGEGGTVTVDRERDLALSAQALVAVEEIDHALAKIDGGTYGACESCGTLIPKNRLEALPFARLCIACKAGGLSRR